MNNILVSLKKFFTNKNTVTVIGVIAILGLLYWGYSSIIAKETNPIRIPVANTTIQPRTEITSEMITYIDVPAAAISKNVVRIANSIIGMYSAVNSVIPAGSMFYSDVLVTKAQLPDSAFVDVKEGERPYALSVTTASTYGNSIFPGNVVDVYMKATDENGQVMVGRLLSQVEILAVKDSQGNHVFEDTSVTRTPATLLFGAPEEVYILLKKTEYLRSYGVELFPVPYGGTAPSADLTVDRQELVDFINSNTVVLSENTNTETTPETGLE